MRGKVFCGAWEKKRIGDVLEILYGKSQRGVASYKGTYPILGTGGLLGKAIRPLCNWESVLIGRKGTIDRPMYMDEPFWPIDTLFFSRPKENVCMKFLYYVFCNIRWRADYMELSNRPTLSRRVIEKIIIPIPPMEEQKAIADVLWSFDEHIRDLAALIERKKKIRDEFIRVLVSGKMRMPGFSGAWEVKTLGELGTFTRGAPFSKADIDIAGLGTPLILYGELYTTYKEVTYTVHRRTKRKTKKKFYSRVGDIIMPTSGETAIDIARATCVMLPGVILGGDLMIYRTDKNIIDSRFLSYAITNIINKKISYMAQGITIMHIYSRLIENISVSFPPLDEQKAIADFITTLDDEINALTEKRETFSVMRTSAIHDLITGKIRLKV